MAAQKINMVGTAHYIFTLSKTEKTRKEIGYMGKLRSDGLGRNYTLYGMGENPKTNLPSEEIRNEYAFIKYVFGNEIVDSTALES